MEKIDRELLIKEISSRLPYGIKAQVLGWDEEKGEVEVPLKVYSINTDGYLSFEYNHYSVETVYVEDCRLYLRPMSSMTEEEKEEFKNKFKGFFQYFNGSIISDSRIYDRNEAVFVGEESCGELIDWLNKKMFDFRRLIPKDLALSTDEFNPYKD